MTTLNLFSDADVATIKEMVRWFSTHRNTPFSEEADETGHQAPEIYIALVPTTGIPALSHSGTAQAGDVPGSAQCGIYQINQYGELTAIPGLTKTVYNLSTTIVASGWIIVVRDKFGRWLPAASGSSSGGSSVNEAFLGQTTEYVASGGFTTLLRSGTPFVCQAAFGPVQHGAFAMALWDSSTALGGPQYLIVQISCPTGTATSHT